MTAPATVRTIEQNLDVLRLIADGHLADLVLHLPADRQERAAAAVVRLEAPIRDAILGASDTDLPAVVRRLIAQETNR